MSIEDTKSNDGGPAYLINAGGVKRGMSLRDYFAGQALAGFWGSETAMNAIGVAHGSIEELSAGFSYAIADAMLREREK